METALGGRKMFKFSFNLVKEICGIEFDENELFEILNLQGFEVDETVKKGDDTIITIEVKANRPDMLSHLGIAREVCAFKGLSIPKLPEVSGINLKKDIEKVPFEVEVDRDAAKRFSLLIIEGLNNTVETPDYIKNILEKLGINCVNAVVDISNYVMLKYGQPMHTYDLDKVSGKTIMVEKSSKDCEILTLGNLPSKIKKGDITISDENEVLCVAGVIGTDKSAVGENTKRVMIEAACFDEVSVRLSSRRLKISTPSSFRFERGIDITQCLNIAKICAKMIIEICGGKIKNTVFDFYPEKKEDNKNFVTLRVSRTNLLLGTKLNKEQIINYLEKYEFRCKKSLVDKESDSINVQIPFYRLDVKSEVDLIEEVARIHGYDNIEPTMPKLQIRYSKNTIWGNIDKLREIFVGLGFYEVINYSFIPSDFTNIFSIEQSSRLYSDLLLKNPINKEYALMRPTLIYSLISSLAYNYSMNNTDIALFEAGRTYFKKENKEKEENKNYRTGCSEIDTFGFIFSGIRIEKGWGIDKDIKYSYYDLLNYVNLVFGKFNQEFKLVPKDYKFLENSSGYDIVVDGREIGFLGEVNKKILNKIQNAKLIKTPVFYCEIYVESLKETPKKLKFESKYPPLMRTYNFVVSKDVPSKKIEEIIRQTSPVIQDIKVRDIYVDQNMKENHQHAILYEIKYCSPHQTLFAGMVEEIEMCFINDLAQKLNVFLKK